MARLFIEGFRSFRQREEIPFVDPAGKADEIAVFHGPNASGKTNALAALEVFFRGIATCFDQKRKSNAEKTTLGFSLPWDWRNATRFKVDRRNWPPGLFSPQVMEVHFENMEPLRLVQIREGQGIALRVERGDQSFVVEAFSKLTSPQWDLLGKLVNEPIGPRSQPFFRFNARRTSVVLYDAPLSDSRLSENPMPPLLADALFALRNSLDPEDTVRWHAFQDLLGRFKTLAGRELNIVRDPQATSEPTDLRFEIRGKQILRLSELSSGEQQIVALCAAVLTSRAAIVAIEEPEISLDSTYQQLLREVLAEQVKNGLVDQVILESHSHVFDGPEVVQFSRTEDELPSTHVTRAPSSLSSGDPKFQQEARAAGAEERWVTRDGYTKLPERMRAHLGVTKAGGNVWFLPSDTTDRWEAWRADEVDEMFGHRGKPE